MEIIFINIDITRHRTELEKQFPTLTFFFFRLPKLNCDVVRVMHRDSPSQIHEEIIDWQSRWPTEDFLARCALIA